MADKSAAIPFHTTTSVPFVASMVSLSLNILHPDNGLPIDQNNTVNLAQIKELSLQHKLNPFPFLRACASPAEIVAIQRMANENGLERREMYMMNPPMPEDIEPEEELDDKAMAHHYRRIAKIELANQLHLIPYIVTISPSPTDRSFVAIMIVSFRKWIARVKLLTIQSKALKATPSIVDVREEILKEPVNSEDLVQAWHQLWDAAEIMIQVEKKGNYKESFAAADDPVKKISIRTGYVCRILKDWTAEWEQERMMHEEAWFHANGDIPLVATGAAPFDPVAPQAG